MSATKDDGQKMATSWTGLAGLARSLLRAGKALIQAVSAAVNTRMNGRV